MTVLLNSGDIAEVLNSWRSRKLTDEQGREKLTLMVEPLVCDVSNKFPMYMREDLRQEIRIRFFESNAKRIYDDYRKGKTSDLIGYTRRVLQLDAVDFSRKVSSADCRLVRIDDLKIELLVFPKTYERSKLIMKIRKALEAFYTNRYQTQGYANRASRFAYVMLKGERPIMATNNLQKFFGGNRLLAQQAYTTGLTIIRLIIERYREELECALEE